ncbi:hypothetical protein BDV59DRAFT_175587, partial [Aspergillus ambiguus]|uniref:uncharacterized protein n=1 Tax=Aspergillus ambiguus TaxID=176160 RepID=UPI003CCD08A1
MPRQQHPNKAGLEVGYFAVSERLGGFRGRFSRIFSFFRRIGAVTVGSSLPVLLMPQAPTTTSYLG